MQPVIQSEALMYVPPAVPWHALAGLDSNPISSPTEPSGKGLDIQNNSDKFPDCYKLARIHKTGNGSTDSSFGQGAFTPGLDDLTPSRFRPSHSTTPTAHCIIDPPPFAPTRPENLGTTGNATGLLSPLAALSNSQPECIWLPPRRPLLISLPVQMHSQKLPLRRAKDKAYQRKAHANNEEMAQSSEIILASCEAPTPTFRTRLNAFLLSL